MTALLSLHGVSRRFGGLVALHGLDLELVPGARHAVIGPNGAGKTTLLNLVAGTLRPSTGHIVYNGQTITRLPATTRARRGVARTWQHPAIFGRLSVVDNLSLALRHRPGRADIAQLLAGVGLADQATAAAGSLPYGRQRQLELAMALAGRPRLLLLDEPSAGLDPDQIAQLVDRITGLDREVAVLLVDHHLDLVWSLADQVTVLHHGRHLITGPPAAVRADAQVRDAYLTTATASPAASPPAAGPALLRVANLTAGYHGAPVLAGIDLEVNRGEAVAVLGRNGAGKTTLLNAIAGLLPAAPGARIDLAGRPLAGAASHHLARAGIAVVPQGRRLFAPLTVTEHVVAAAPGGRYRAAGKAWSLQEILALLPSLACRANHPAHRLSGGEQQMLALARALAAGPVLLILDEPSEGLAPAVISQLSQALTTLVAEGIALLVAEQNLAVATALTHRHLLLHSGHIALTGTTGQLHEPAHRRRLDGLLGVTGGLALGATGPAVGR